MGELGGTAVNENKFSSLPYLAIVIFIEGTEFLLTFVFSSHLLTDLKKSIWLGIKIKKVHKAYIYI